MPDICVYLNSIPELHSSLRPVIADSPEENWLIVLKELTSQIAPIIQLAFD